MARPKNEELEAKIQKAAWTLFQSVGYEKATYAAIAERCNVSRNLVQYHVPKKELLAISFMEHLLARAQTSINLSDSEVQGNVDAIYQVGTVFFETLLANSGTRTFLLDIIRSRDLTESVLAFNTQWALAHSDAANGSADYDQVEVERSVILHMGGFYELLYHCLKNERPFDVAAELKWVVEAFAQSMGKKWS